MAEDTSGNMTSVGLEPPPLPADPPPSNVDDRRKSLGLLKDITTSWPVDPIPRKYSLSESVSGCRLKEGSAIEDLTKTSDDLSLTSKIKSSASPTTAFKQSVHFAPKETNPAQRKSERRGGDSTGPSSMPPTPNTALKMSSMEEEAIRERLRTVTLRQISQILDDDSVGSRFTRDNFRRTFLNKVSTIYKSKLIY